MQRNFVLCLEHALSELVTSSDISSSELSDLIFYRHQKDLQNSDRIIITHLREVPNVPTADYYVKIFFPAIQELCERLSNLSRPLLIFNKTYGLLPDHNKFYDLVEIDVFRLQTYIYTNFCVGMQQAPLNSINKNGRYLCLMGKFHKDPSQVLINFFYDKNLLDQSKGDWSLFTDFNIIAEDFENSTARLKSKWTDFPSRKLEEFVPYSRSLDNLGKLNDTIFSYVGFPFDRKLYENTELSITRESLMLLSRGTFLSEKYWRPIAMRHPVMLLGYEACKKDLQNQGYRCVNNFESCDIFSQHTYADALDLFEKNLQIHMGNPDNQEVANHNYNLYRLHCEQDIEKLSKIMHCFDAKRSRLYDTIMHWMMANSYGNDDHSNNINTFDFAILNEYLSDIR